MKKYLITALSLMTFGFVSCKKDKDLSSKVVKQSYPTITYSGKSFTGSSQEDYYLNTITINRIGFVSVGTGQASIYPTAYDSLLKETEVVGISYDGQMNPGNPGLYCYDFYARNSNGYYSNARYYVAVTDVNQAWDLSGKYKSNLGDTTVIERKANGLYLHRNITGGGRGLAMMFAQTNDTTIMIPKQPGEFSTQNVAVLSGVNGSVHVNGGDTTISYQIVNTTINGLYPGKTFVFTKI